MRTSVTLQILLFAAGAGALAQSPGTFTPTGAMILPRFDFTARLLQDGRVLIAGGIEASAVGIQASTSAELYNPSTGTFTATAHSRTGPSVSQSATLLPDGRVLLAGGMNPDGRSATALAEIFDPSTSSFTPAGSMSAAKACPSTALLNNGKVLVAGGSLSGQPANTATAELYDPAANTFTSAGPYASIGGSIASGLGWCPIAVPRPDGKVTIIWLSPAGTGQGSASEVFDPATSTFTALPSFQPVPANGSVQLGSGLVLFAGEYYGLGAGADNLAELYDPVLNLVTPTGNMNVERSSQIMVLLPDGTVLVAGWAGGQSAEIFDPSSGTFTLTGVFPVDYPQTGTLLPDGTVLISGNSSPGSNVNYIYHPSKLVPAPALFSLSGGGAGQGAIWNPATGQAASSQSPSAAGNILSMYTTSLIAGGVMPPQVSVGGLLANVLWFGDAPGYPGYFQVNFQVPSGVAAGDAVPVRLIYFGRSSDAVTIATH